VTAPLVRNGDAVLVQSSIVKLVLGFFEFEPLMF